MKKLFVVMMAICAMTMVACSSKKAEKQGQKSLVLYYSQSGVTKQVAEQIRNLTNADIEAIEVEEPYDGDFQATVQRVLIEREEGVLPTLKALNVNIEEYDVIYLGYPIWFGTYAPPITALVKEYDFAGKTIVPFCSFGSGGIEATENDLKEALPKAVIHEGYGVRTARIDKMPAEIEYFLKKNQFIEGEVELLPEFSEQQPVGEEEKELFSIACDDYQFPLGAPLTYGKRIIAFGTEYEFHTDVNSVIYVVKYDGENAVVEFTKVVR